MKFNKRIKLVFAIVPMIGVMLLVACGGGDEKAGSKGNEGEVEFKLDFSHFFPPAHF